jgi:hypothetical protein
VKSKRPAEKDSEKDSEGPKRHPALPTRILSYENNMRKKRKYAGCQSWRKPENNPYLFPGV